VTTITACAPIVFASYRLRRGWPLLHRACCCPCEAMKLVDYDGYTKKVSRRSSVVLAVLDAVATGLFVCLFLVDARLPLVDATEVKTRSWFLADPMFQIVE